MMTYKGYIGQFEYDPGDHNFTGHVVNIRDLITFEGTSVAGLEKSLARSVEVYLEHCQETGSEPNKLYTG